MRQRLSHFAVEQRESSRHSSSNTNNSIIVINNRYFMECLLRTRHRLKCFWNKPKKCYHYVAITDEEIEAREVKKPAQRHTASR